MIDDGHAVAEDLRFVHVVRRQQDRAAARRGTAEHGSQSCRRDCGSRPVVGSSRNSSSGSPASAHASASRCFCPPDSLTTQLARFRFELDDLEQFVDGAPAVVEGAEQAERLLDGQLVGELRLLELDAEALTQLALVVRASVSPSTSTSPASGVEQPFEDLDRRRLAGAVRSEQPEAFAALARRATGRRRRRRRRSACAGSSQRSGVTCRSHPTLCSSLASGR